MFTKNNPHVGARPGTLAIPENSPEPRIRVTQYSANDVEPTYRTSATDPTKS